MSDETVIDVPLKSPLGQSIVAAFDVALPDEVVSAIGYDQDDPGRWVIVFSSGRTATLTPEPTRN